MIVKRIIDNIKSKKIIDIKYIVIELALIFTGITLAAKYNQYQSQQQDELFLKETLIQIHSELKTDNQINSIYCKGQKQKIEELTKLKKILLDRNESELNSDEIKTIIADLPNTLSISNSILGYKKLEAKNINLIKEIKIKNDLIGYYDMMVYNQIDVTNFNNDISDIKPFMSRYFKNFSLWDRSYDSIINPDKLMNDPEFLNTINFIISDLKINVDTNEKGTIPKSKEIINELEEKYTFLTKEKTKKE